MSYFEYNNFFSATLFWQPVSYAEYYKGYRVVESTDTGWVYLSPLLSPTASEFEIQTMPGMSGEYYVIAFSTNDLYNDIQPDKQKILLEVPAMEYPAGFNGTLRRDSTIRLLWEPIAYNNTWYSGYLLEKKIITDTLVYDWEELSRIPGSITGIYEDEVADSGSALWPILIFPEMRYIPKLTVFQSRQSDSISVPCRDRAGSRAHVLRLSHHYMKKSPPELREGFVYLINFFVNQSSVSL